MGDVAPAELGDRQRPLTVDFENVDQVLDPTLVGVVGVRRLVDTSPFQEAVADPRDGGLVLPS